LLTNDVYEKNDLVVSKCGFEISLLGQDLVNE